MKLLIILLLTPFFANSQVKAKHNPRYMEEGIHLKHGGEIAKDYSMCKLVNVKKTMKGFKHTFITDSIGILYRFYNRPFVVDSCYYVKTVL